MEEVGRFDDVRTAILEYLDKVMAKASNENTARETDASIQMGLRNDGYSMSEVNQELIYLVERGYVKQKVVKSSSSDFGGVSKMKFSTTYYYISSKGRDFLHGDSDKFKSSSYFGGININNIQGAIAIGENNVAIVQKPNINVYQALNELKDAVLESKEIADAEKGEYAADIETLKNQVAKKVPNIKIIEISWQTLQVLATIPGIIDFYNKVSPLIAHLLQNVK